MAASCIKRDNSVVTVDPVLGQSKLFQYTAASVSPGECRLQGLGKLDFKKWEGLVKSDSMEVDLYCYNQFVARPFVVETLTLHVFE